MTLPPRLLLVLLGLPIVLAGALGCATDERVCALAFSGDGSRLALATDLGDLRVWDVTKGTDLSRREVPTSAYWVGIGPDRNLLLLATFEEGLVLWDVSEKQSIWTSGRPESRIRSVGVSPDGSSWVVGHQSGEMAIWNAPTRSVRANFGGPGVPFHFSFSPDSSLIAIVEGMLVRVRKTSDGKSTWEYDTHCGNVYAVAFSPDGRRLAVACLREIRILEVSTHRIETVLKLEDYEAFVESLAWLDGGSAIAAGIKVEKRGSNPLSPCHGNYTTYSGRLMCWDARSGKVLGRARDLWRGVDKIAAGPDGRKVAYATTGWDLDFWQPDLRPD